MGSLKNAILRGVPVDFVGVSVGSEQFRVIRSGPEDVELEVGWRFDNFDRQLLQILVAVPVGLRPSRKGPVNRGAVADPEMDD